MKRLIAGLYILFATTTLAATFSLSVSTSSKTVVPADTAFPREAVVSNAVAQGAVVSYSGVPYMALSATNELPASPDANLVRIGKEKASAIVQNTGSVAFWIAAGAPAVAGKGIRIDPGVTATFDNYSGSISAVTAGGTAAVSALIIYAK